MARSKHTQAKRDAMHRQRAQVRRQQQPWNPAPCRMCGQRERLYRSDIGGLCSICIRTMDHPEAKRSVLDKKKPNATCPNCEGTCFMDGTDYLCYTCRVTF